MLGTRGGGCYELNGLFSELLVGLGFKVEMYNAHIFVGGTFVKESRHLFIGVELGQLWLADVGLDTGLVHPLSWIHDVQQTAFGLTYKYLIDEEGTTLQKYTKGSWKKYPPF